MAGVFIKLPPISILVFLTLCITPMPIKRKIKPNFLSIPYELIIDDRLTPLNLKVYGIILWFKNTTKQKKCFVKNSTIAELLSSKDRKIISVGNSLNALEKLKYVKRIYADKERNFRLEIIPKILLNGLSSNDERVSSNDERVSSNDERVSLNDESLSSNDGHSNNIYSNKDSNKDIDIITHTPFSKKTLLKILKWYHYTISKKATSEKLVLTLKAQRVISEALKDYSPLDLLLAIKGFSEDNWQMEKNGFRGVEWFFSDSKRLGQYIGLFNKHQNKSFIKKAEKFLNE